MKINILVGARFQAAQLAKILLKSECDVRVYSSSPVSKWKLDKKYGKVVYFVPLFANIFTTVSKIPLPNFIKELSVSVFDFLTAILMRKSDVLHAWSSFGLISIKKAKKNGTIIFVEKSCPHPYFQYKLLNEEARYLGAPPIKHSNRFINRILEEFELADKIVVCSTYTLNSFLDNGISKDKLYNIALDSNFYPVRAYNKNYQKDGIVVGSVGGNVIRKGFIYLLQAWKELNIPNSKLLLKTSKQELMKIPKIWNLIKGDESIEIVGYVNDMEDFYGRLDLFVLPSIDEGFGMVVFEALACSLPIIITKNVGAGDFVTNGKEGYIIDIRSSQQIKEKIFNLNHDRSLIKTMSINAKITFDNYQTNDENYQNRVKRLYESCNLTNNKLVVREKLL